MHMITPTWNLGRSSVNTFAVLEESPAIGARTSGQKSSHEHATSSRRNHRILAAHHPILNPSHPQTFSRDAGKLYNPPVPMPNIRCQKNANRSASNHWVPAAVPPTYVNTSELGKRPRLFHS